MKDRNYELQKEIKSLQRIQQDQGKALEKISNDFDYPTKIKYLYEELRSAKEKIKDLDEKTKREQRNQQIQHEYRIKLEEACRNLKQQLKNRDDKHNISQISIDVDIKDNKSIEELQRANKILSKQKEVNSKKNQYFKNKVEKRTQKLLIQIEFLQNQLIEKDKEIKLYQLKLKEFLKINKNSLNQQSQIELEQIITPQQEGLQNVPLNENYKKIREINQKYQQEIEKLKKIQKLTIDIVNDSSIQTNKYLDDYIDRSLFDKNIGNRTIQIDSNRSKSIDPTSKKIIGSMPISTRKMIKSKNKIQIKDLIEEKKEKIEYQTFESTTEQNIENNFNLPEIKKDEFNMVEQYVDKLYDIQKERQEVFKQFLQTNDQTFYESNKDTL